MCEVCGVVCVWGEVVCARVCVGGGGIQKDLGGRNCSRVRVTYSYVYVGGCVHMQRYN